MEVVLTCVIKLELNEDFTSYDRLCLGDKLVKEFKKSINERKDCKLISIKGVIDSTELKGK